MEKRMNTGITNEQGEDQLTPPAFAGFAGFFAASLHPRFAPIVAPWSVGRGAPLGGDRPAEGMPATALQGARIPLRGRTLLRKALLRPARSHIGLARDAQIRSRINSAKSRDPVKYPG
jgi:hypothetical protein